MSERQLTLFEVGSANKRRRLDSAEETQTVEDEVGNTDDEERDSVLSPASPSNDQQADRGKPAQVKSGSQARQCNYVTVQNPSGPTTVIITHLT